MSEILICSAAIIFHSLMWAHPQALHKVLSGGLMSVHTVQLQGSVMAGPRAITTGCASPSLLARCRLVICPCPCPSPDDPSMLKRAPRTSACLAAVIPKPSSKSRSSPYSVSCAPTRHKINTRHLHGLTLHAPQDKHSPPKRGRSSYLFLQMNTP
jgi:hypothetical protein